VSRPLRDMSRCQTKLRECDGVAAPHPARGAASVARTVLHPSPPDEAAPPGTDRSRCQRQIRKRDGSVTA